MTPLTLTPLTPSLHIGCHRAVTPLFSARKAEDERSHSGVIAKDERRKRFFFIIIHIYSFVMSSSDKPVAFMMSAMLKPIDFRFLAVSIMPSARPSARPSSRPSARPSARPSSRPISMPSATPSLFAVSKLFLMSRYALRLS